MVKIRDTRQMNREERMAAAERSDKERAIKRAEQRRLHNERNAAAIKAQQEIAALTPGQRAQRRRQMQQEKMARHKAANEAAEAKAAPGPPANKMLTPARENKTTVTVTPPREPKAAPAKAPAKPATVAVTAESIDATDAAVKLAKKHKIDLSKVKGTGSGGRITVNDVEAKIG